MNYYNMDCSEYRNMITSSDLNQSIAVQAGPGSGKTTLLIERLKFILNNKKKKHAGVACITYTNVAKNEIIQRLTQQNISMPKELFIGTIHSFLLEFIIQPYSHFYNSYSIPFKIAYPGFSYNHKQYIEKLTGRKIHEKDSTIFRDFDSIDRDAAGRPISHLNQFITTEIALQWKEYLKKNGYIDQQDIIYLSYKILKDCPHIKNGLEARFPYFLIDEYQDSTLFQDKIFDILNASSFFCVGDFNQAIFSSFTSADPALFQSKWQNPKFKCYELQINFRSTKNIVDFCNLKSTFQQQVEHNKLKSKIAIIVDVLEPYEALRIFNKLKPQIDNLKDDSNDYLILTRRNKSIKLLQSATGKLIETSTSIFFEKLAENNPRIYHIFLNLITALAYKKKNQFPEAIEKMDLSLSHLIFNCPSAFKSLNEISYNNFMWKKLLISTLYYIESLEKMKIIDFLTCLKSYLNNFSKQTYNKPIGTKLKILDYNWKNQLKIVRSMLIEDLIKDRHSELSYEHTDQTILTIHNSKGLEARSVFIHAENEDELLEWLEENSQEEARIGYVAFSRAEEFLCLWSVGLNKEKFSHLNNLVDLINSEGPQMDIIVPSEQITK